MFPLRLSLFALIFLAVLGMSQEVEADDWEPSLEYVGDYQANDWAFSLAISGNYAYVSDGNNGLIILDIEDPANPTFEGSYDTYKNDTMDIAISGNYAYVSEGSKGLIILDIEDPSNPTFEGSYETDSYIQDIAISGNYAYVADGGNGLVILNIEDPANPTWVGSYDTDAYGVAISGNYAYVADSNDGLVILNIEDPANPTWVGSYDTDGYAYGVTISGNYTYVADENNGLVILNIEDPANPTFEGSYDTDGSAVGVTISGNYAYVSDYNNGVIILDIEDPSNPTLVGSYDTYGYAYEVAVSGNYTYVADGNQGLVILNFGYTPRAVIDSIYPSPARFDDEITFSGSGEDYDGIIVAYEWTNEGDLWSDEEDFSIVGLSTTPFSQYNILFRVQDNSGRWSDYDIQRLSVYPNNLPFASVSSISPSPAEEGTTVLFNGTSSDSDGTIVAYLWESSIDGQLSTDEDFSSNNLSLGRHVITFMVQDNDGDSKTVNQELWIYASPVAIAGQDSTGTPGVPLQFSGAGTDEDGTIAKYEWDFDGDGVFEWSSTENGRELNIYNNEDTYTATLRVTDNDGFTDTDTVEIIISEKKIQIDDDGNVTVTDAGEDEEGIPGFGIIGAVVSIGLIARFRRR